MRSSTRTDARFHVDVVGWNLCAGLLSTVGTARRYERTNEVVRFQNGIYPFDQIARRAACSLWPLIYRAFISVY